MKPLQGCVLITRLNPGLKQPWARISQRLWRCRLALANTCGVPGSN